MSLGYSEIIVIVLVIIILFGAKRIPELARSLGRAKQEYKKAQEEFISGIESPDEKKIPADKAEEKKDEKQA